MKCRKRKCRGKEGRADNVIVERVLYQDVEAERWINRYCDGRTKAKYVREWINDLMDGGPSFSLLGTREQ